MRHRSWNRGGLVARVAAAAAAAGVIASSSTGCGIDARIDAPARYECFELENPYAGAGAWHRANFHMHSRHSDGALSGEELVGLYAQHGYSLLSLTDHNQYGDQDGGVVPALQTDSLPHDWNNDGTAQPAHVFGSGSEAYVRDWTRPAPGWSVERWSRSAYFNWSEAPTLLPGAEFSNGGLHVGLLGYPGGAIEPPLKDSVALPPAAQRTLRAGGIVFLAHPGEWNSTPQNLTKFVDRHAFEAIEIANGLRLTQSLSANVEAARAGSDPGCAASPAWDATPTWDGLLARGYRLWGMANDDEHKGVGASDAYPFTAFNMVLTNDPTETGYMRSLHAGAFYGSTGLYFAALGVKDGTIVVWAPEASQIRFIGWAGRVLAAAVGGHATYHPQGDEGYVRVEAAGVPQTTPWTPQAWSQPFWIHGAPCGGASTQPHPSGE